MDLIDAWRKRDPRRRPQRIFAVKLSMLDHLLEAVFADGIAGLNPAEAPGPANALQRFLCSAEAIIDFAESWLPAKKSTATRIRDIVMELYLIGETRASEDFKDIAWGLFIKGDIGALNDLFRDVNPSSAAARRGLKPT
jgi:hypothetical protein